MKKIALIALVGIAGLTGFLVYYFYKDTEDPYVQACDYTVPESEVPNFTEIPSGFKHQFDGAKSLPMMAVALIDFDSDGTDELFVGGGNKQPDAFLKYSGGAVSNIASKVFSENKNSDDPSLGAIAADMDNDGQTDLIVCRTSGVYFYKNEGAQFLMKKLEIPFNEKSTPLSLTSGDINRDGHLDLFVAGYVKVELMEGQTIFTDKSYGATSVLLINNGDQTFKNMTIEYGLNYIHNTFQGVMVDVDSDGWLDLVVAHDTGEVRTYRNSEGKRFEMVKNPTTGKFSYPMGIAVGDYNNDGTVDFFFSNTGSSIPEFMARGDLKDDQVFIKEWMLFKNEQKFNFTDVAAETKLADFEFSWGATFEDFNLDGLQDLAVAENYIAFPPQQAFPLPCRLLIQRNNGTFAAVEEQANAVNKNFAIAPLTTDFNKDGYPDLIYSNLNGPLKILVSNRGENNYVKVRMKKNAMTLGSRVELHLPNRRLTQFLLSGEGLCSDQSETLIFGLAKDSLINQIVIQYPSGKTETLKNIGINSQVSIK